MKNTSPQVDAYIAAAPEYARPILKKLRQLFHNACSDIKETMKWRFPHFEYKGIVGSMAAFKHYVSLGFWKGSLMRDPHGLFKGVGSTVVSGLKLSSIDELPSDKTMLAYIRAAVALNEDGVKLPAPKRNAKKEVVIPEYFLAALKKNKKAQATFDAFSYSHKKDYVEWITEAKQEATRARRLATALEWLAEGKPRNWKYMNC